MVDWKHSRHYTLIVELAVFQNCERGFYRNWIMPRYSIHSRNFLEIKSIIRGPSFSEAFRRRFSEQVSTRSTHLQDLQLSHKKFQEIFWYKGTITDCDMSNCSFNNVVFDSVICTHTDFTHAHFLQSIIANSVFENQDFTNCTFDTVKLIGSFRGCNFSQVKLNDCTFNGFRDSLDFRDSNFVGAQIHNVDFTSCKLYNAKFSAKQVFWDTVQGHVKFSAKNLREITVID